MIPSIRSPRWLTNRRVNAIYEAAKQETAEAEAAYLQGEQIIDKVCKTEASTAAGIVAQLQMMQILIERCGGNIWADERDLTLLDSIAAGVERLARRVAPG